MDFKYVEEFDGGIVIKGVRNFNLSHIFDCGQCFRWNRQENGNYIGVAFGRVIELEKREEDVVIYNTTEEDFENIWVEYFDLYRDYSSIKEILGEDELLKKSVEFGDGIRILKQEPFEITLSFIISANNRIPMIKKAIDNISKKWGKPMEYKGHTYYTFPSIDDLANCTIDELSDCGTGFRAKYIRNTIDDILSDKIDLEYIKGLNDDECHIALQNLSGVGPKVADCIMLFSMQKYSAFPVDVWVKRAMQHFYLAPDVSLKKIREFGRNKFKEFSGFAQQYLFYYARENNIKL
ncbi:MULTISPECIES: DNA-3-methyladenine glycosylase family protein [Clostridium]|uniref:DNA-(apurinic or apyrimidinic site) lyase n=2 Tax=Clostridium TaxID=1485 RepID=A0A151ANX1_9CLOT|nr:MULTISPECIES: DNA-3-methyladenine glycosylase [Clostridium]KYH29323.1 DNA-3-methyladenine glycosylase [Clostridium colicanis DSM 13634]MBE6043332.1 DNA-3-methyladenine glycosylase 2 family protein [Clostridium thermopalmarium]PRR70963.1 DNA-3-methyladenine glycosylase [Clostridium thermopalmarium DSM 5974]PVZ28885.1 N-glycosylase/DNA lyase [Clostridium thermopalmarium DSM 5974]